VAGRPRMFAGMTVGGIVATMGAATVLAGPQLHPPRADLHALVAFTSLGLLHALDGIDVGAASIWHVITSVAGGRRGANYRFT